MLLISKLNPDSSPTKLTSFVWKVSSRGDNKTFSMQLIRKVDKIHPTNSYYAEAIREPKPNFLNIKFIREYLIPNLIRTPSTYAAQNLITKTFSEIL